MASCGGGSKGSDPTPVAVLPPVMATLTFPAQNELCTQGTVISATQSTLVFKWAASANTDSYDVTLKNLLTNVTNTQNVTQNLLELTVDRNTPYAWYVTSKSSKTTTVAQSDTWKFYNSGPGTVSYAPFPAEITSPLMGQTVTAVNGKVTLKWNGSDVDNDIVSYDVYCSNSLTPTLILSALTDTKYEVNATPGTTYYWKIVTIDSKGNKSDSNLSKFLVN
jgi:hypothetical protein